jgi:hypothetical protein
MNASVALGPSQRVCACGCGQPLPVSPRGNRLYVNRAHEQRAYRDRSQNQLSLLPVLGRAGE